ncbi:MAG: hypothetical protein VB039_01190 [Oscillospiraceae bacterium]|nr:hypothetical protein [Oscillospiraceae bacterium]
MNTKHPFNLKQLLALGSVVLLSPALRLFPAGVAAEAGRAVWLSPAAALPILLAYAFFLCRFMGHRREGEGLAELSLRCLGATAGRAFLALLAAWLLLYAGFVLRAGADRFVTIIYPFARPAFFVLTTGLFSLCFLSGMTPKEERPFRRLSGWLLAMAALLTAISLAVVGNFGAALTDRLSRPFFMLVRNLVFFGSVERVEALVVTFWIFPDFLLVALLLFSAQRCLRLALGGRAPEYRGERPLDLRGGRWVIPLCGAAAILLGLLLAPTPAGLERWSEELVPLMNQTAAFVPLPLVYAVGKIKKRL